MNFNVSLELTMSLGTSWLRSLKRKCWSQLKAARTPPQFFPHATGFLESSLETMIQGRSAPQKPEQCFCEGMSVNYLPARLSLQTRNPSKSSRRFYLTLVDAAEAWNTPRPLRDEARTEFIACIETSYGNGDALRYRLGFLELYYGC